MSDQSSSDSGYSNVDYDLKLRELTMQQLFNALQTNGRRVTQLAVALRGDTFIFWSEGQYYTYYLEVETFIRNVLAHDNADRLRRGMQHRSPDLVDRLSLRTLLEDNSLCIAL
ncbi:hypothetical protein Mgra_00003625 [Meloidogyne graminicola]|uniref:Uncharacterized protein n=1 Tax=Meloidogyne graminicola TaxID=189291 RepID=A0A8S9ZUD4_9BILA|nr:hypothetical protein Mgra_00003625 [Meloidogyne graminicola]